MAGSLFGGDSGLGGLEEEGHPNQEHTEGTGDDHEVFNDAENEPSQKQQGEESVERSVLKNTQKGGHGGTPCGERLGTSRSSQISGGCAICAGRRQRGE